MSNTTIILRYVLLFGLYLLAIFYWRRYVIIRRKDKDNPSTLTLVTLGTIALVFVGIIAMLLVAPFEALFSRKKFGPCPNCGKTKLIRQHSSEAEHAAQPRCPHCGMLVGYKHEFYAPMAPGARNTTVVHPGTSVEVACVACGKHCIGERHDYEQKIEAGYPVAYQCNVCQQYFCEACSRNKVKHGLFKRWKDETSLCPSCGRSLAPNPQAVLVQWKESEFISHFLRPGERYLAWLWCELRTSQPSQPGQGLQAEVGQSLVNPDIHLSYLLVLTEQRLFRLWMNRETQQPLGLDSYQLSTIQLEEQYLEATKEEILIVRGADGRQTVFKSLEVTEESNAEKLVMLFNSKKWETSEEYYGPRT